MAQTASFLTPKMILAGKEIAKRIVGRFTPPPALALSPADASNNVELALFLIKAYVKFIDKIGGLDIDGGNRPRTDKLKEALRRSARNNGRTVQQEGALLAARVFLDNLATNTHLITWINKSLAATFDHNDQYELVVSRLEAIHPHLQTFTTEAARLLSPELDVRRNPLYPEEVALLANRHLERLQK